MSRKRAEHEAPERLRRSLESFAAHLRNPELNAAPEGIEDRRMEIYRGLFFRNIRGFLASNFPVLRKLHSAQDWDALTRDFYDRHRSSTPLFPEIPREFLKYLQDERGDCPGDLPFMLELAHYEWVELALSLDTVDLATIPAEPDGDLLAGTPVLSPLAWPLSYRFPVHEIRPEYQPLEPPAEPTHLLVYRNRSDEVKFMALNPVTLRLVGVLKESGDCSGLDVLKQLAQEMNHPDPHVVIAGGQQLLQDLRSRDIILGTRPA
jgi:hypothetical protein